MKPTLKRCGKHSDSLVPTGKKRGSSQQKSAIGKTVLTTQLKEQAAQIQKVSAQFESSKPAPQVVSNP
jgi:hypothetical protein